MNELTEPTNNQKVQQIDLPRAYKVLADVFVRSALTQLSSKEPKNVKKEL